LDDDQNAPPARPEPRECDPEGAIERGQSRSRPPLHVDGELLPQGQLDNGLLPATPEERDETSGDRRQELEQRSHAGRNAARVRGEEEA
jgi:hypothetical protein